MARGGCATRLVGAPASLVGLDEGQIFVADKLGQARNRSKLLAPRLRVLAEYGAGKNAAASAACLFGRQNIGATNLELPFSPTLVAIALIVGLAPRAADLD